MHTMSITSNNIRLNLKLAHDLPWANLGILDFRRMCHSSQMRPVASATTTDTGNSRHFDDKSQAYSVDIAQNKTDRNCLIPSDTLPLRRHDKRVGKNAKHP